LRVDGFVRRGTSESDWARTEQVKRKWEAAGTVADVATSFQELASLGRLQRSHGVADVGPPSPLSTDTNRFFVTIASGAGQTVDSFLNRNRDINAAKSFLRSAMKNRVFASRIFHEKVPALPRPSTS